MLKKFKQWLYMVVAEKLNEDRSFLRYVAQGLIDDEGFIRNVYVLLEKERERVAFEKRESEARKSAAYKLSIIKNKQDRCRHTKGGSVPSPNIDYNIWIHTFPGEVGTTVRCLTCGKEWKGEQLKSDEVQQMIKRTTNTATASEVDIVKDGKVVSSYVDRKEPMYMAPGTDSAPKQSIMGYIVAQMTFLRRLSKSKQGQPDGPDNIS